MPAVSESQHRLMCLALAIKRGDASAEKFPHAAKAAEGMSEEQLREY